MTLGITSGGGKNTAIGIGMWLGLYMAFNVWFIIWPNQKRALGMVECEPEIKTKSARTAMLFSRTNTLLVFAYATINGSSTKPLLIIIIF